MYIEETVYTARDNAIVLALYNDSVLIAHNQLTRVQIKVGETLIDSAVNPEYFNVTQSDRLSISLGSAGLTAGRYTAMLVIFDAAHVNGLVFGELVVRVKSV